MTATPETDSPPGAKTVAYSRVTMSHMMLPQDANPAGIVHGGVVMHHIDDAAGVVALRERLFARWINYLGVKEGSNLQTAFTAAKVLAILLMNVFAPTIDHYVVRGNVRKRLKRFKTATIYPQTTDDKAQELKAETV